MASWPHACVVAPHVPVGAGACGAYSGAVSSPFAVAPPAPLPVSPRSSRTLQRLAEMLERHRIELKQEMHQARLVMQQPVSPRHVPQRTERAQPSGRCAVNRAAAAPTTQSGGCQVMLQNSGDGGSASRCASVPGLPALDELHALAEAWTKTLLNLADSLREDEKQIVAGLEKLFAERPLWLRGPAEERLKEMGLSANVSTMQKSFICVSYLWSDGPWRQVYIRLGFDPRTDPGTRFMQVIDFRDRLLKERRAYFERVQGTMDQQPVQALDCHFRTPPVNRSQLYQYLDIEDEATGGILQSSEVLKECSFKTGWLPQQTLDAIRERMAVKALKDEASGTRQNLTLPVMFARPGMLALRRVVQQVQARPSLRRVPRSAAASALVLGAGVGGYCAKPAWCTEDVDWTAVKKEIVKILDDDTYKESVHVCTFCAQTKTGGSNGATMRFEPELSWGANAGLKLAQDMLEPVKKKFPAASYADLWIFAACVAIEEMGGEKVPFAPGRKDKASGAECPAWDGPTCKEG
eukprot:g9595.t1